MTRGDAWYSPFPVDPATVVSMTSTSMRADTATVLEQARQRGVTARLTPTPRGHP